MKTILIISLYIFTIGCTTVSNENQKNYTNLEKMFEGTVPKICHPNLGGFSPLSKIENKVIAVYQNDTKQCEDAVYSNGVVINGILTTDSLEIENFRKKYWDITLRKIAYSYDTELSNQETEELLAYQSLKKEVARCMEKKGWKKALQPFQNQTPNANPGKAQSSI